MVAGWPRLMCVLVVLAGTVKSDPAPVPVDWTDCVQGCLCKWISGKKTALCKEGGFVSVPASLNSDVQVLDLSGNSIARLTREIFGTVGLLNLQKIFLRSSGIRDVHKDAFKDLKILVEVDLAENFIVQLHPDTFTGNERLRLLNMNGNPITELVDSQFPFLPHLKSLEFQNCQIKSIRKNAFLHLPALETLILTGNNLNHLSELVFLPIPRLKTLQIEGNPWLCDCELRNFRNWLLKSNLYSYTLTCANPIHLRSKKWQDITSHEFACPSVVSMTNTIIQGEPRGNLTLLCHISGDPEPRVKWTLNGGQIANVSKSGNLSEGALFFVEEKFEADRRGGKWSALSIYNLSDSEVGEYICEARNILGNSKGNVTVLLPKEPVATTIRKTQSPWFVIVAIVGGSSASIFSLLAIVCWCYNRSSRKTSSRRRNVTQEQDKKLLDMSISTMDRQSVGGCEGSQQDMEMMAHPIQALRDQPLHITIESHPDPSIGVYPPPPEFANGSLPYGNIFISVSVGQNRNADPRNQPAPPVFPDLLEIPSKSVYSATSNPISYYATLPRKNTSLKMLPPRQQPTPPLPTNFQRIAPTNLQKIEDESTISLPEAISAEDIPAPPPPPKSIPLNVDYISV